MTSIEPVVALAAFAFAASITPGPNNMVLAASGATFGFRRTVPCMLGTGVGFAALILAAGIGGELLLSAVPWLESALRFVGTAYLLYLAWRIATAGRAEAKGGTRPVTFWEAAAFQFVNPKGVGVAISAHAAFRIPELGAAGSILTVTLVFALVSILSICAWAGLGTTAGRFLQSDRALRAFNLVLGGLTAASAALLFL